MKKIIIGLFSILTMANFALPSYAAMDSGVWINDLTELFAVNQANILAINIRSFNAIDKNKDDIIEPEKGDTAGNFVNAIKRLNALQSSGINTVHLLPITPVGKVKAMGTAGSLYAISNFTTLNSQLDDPTNNLSVMQEAKNFINECHKRNIRVIVDLPSCGSYDLYLSNPNLFVLGNDGQPVVPADWTDVRLFKALNEDGKLNDELFILYKKYVDMVQRLGADGIRADVATSKPYEFWKQLISYAKDKDPQFLFLAEASESWSEPIAKNAPFTPYYKLLEAGFDGWYGSFFDFKNWAVADKMEKELSIIKTIKKEFSEKKQNKAVIGSFATHDELSPIITGGVQYSDMIIWLQATLPLNSYFVDGFQSGDSYQYKYSNQKADKTVTDDDVYYVHKGKFDIFNFSRKPGGDSEFLDSEFAVANRFKLMAAPIINNGELTFLKTSNPAVFAYTINYKFSTILVVLNKDLAYQSQAVLTLKNFNKGDSIIPFKIQSYPKIEKNKLSLNLKPAEILVMLISAEDKTKKGSESKKTAEPVYKSR